MKRIASCILCATLMWASQCIAQLGFAVDASNQRYDQTNSEGITSVVVGAADMPYSGHVATNNVLNVSGSGTVLSSDAAMVGKYADANLLRVESGAQVESGRTLVGMDGGSGNRVEVSGTGSQLNSQSLRVGSHASGNALDVTTGGAVAGQSLDVGVSDRVGDSARGNQVNVSGAGSSLTVSGSTIIGNNAGNNELNVRDGASFNSGGATIGRGSSSYTPPGVPPSPYEPNNNRATVSGAGSSWNVDGTLSIGDSGSGNTVAVGDGAELTVQRLNISGTGNSMDLDDGGTLRIRDNFNAGMAGFNFGSNSTLAVEGSVSGLGILEEGRRLETPSILGDLEVRGTLAPGNSPADSRLDGDLFLTESGVLEMELGGYQLGDEYDHLAVGGDATLRGMLIVSLIDRFTPTNGASFDLFDWEGAVDGTFDIQAPTLAGDLEWDTSRLYTDGTLSVIPEPATLGIMALVAGGTYFLRRWFV